MGDDTDACARWLVMAALDTDLTGYAARMREPMPPGQYALLKDMVARCARGEPLQHVLGWWEFDGLRLRTDRRALIPRPETEGLVRKALELTVGRRPLGVIDIGCGTGCVGLAFAAHRPDADVTLCDMSGEALELAAENAARLGIPVRLLRADMSRPLPGAPYGLIVSNPPYIPSGEIDALAPVVRDYEPRMALDGGPDGLSAYRALAARFRDSLAPGGWIVLEVGEGQADAVCALLAPGSIGMERQKDLAGTLRVVAARRALKEG